MSAPKFEKVTDQCKLDGCRNPAATGGYCFRHSSLAKMDEAKPKPVKMRDLEDAGKDLVEILTGTKKPKKNDKK